MSRYHLEDALREAEAVLDMWEFMAKPEPFNDKEGLDGWTPEDAKKHYGTWTDDDGEEQICTNAAMQSMVKLMKAAKAAIKADDKYRSEKEWELRRQREATEKAEKHAAMSDLRIADELDREIKWFEANEGDENLVYGPVKLMGYCRDRLRNR